jgi:hypothetical protein
MHLPPSAAPSRRARLWFRGMLGVWIALAVIICARAALWPAHHSVYPIFADAGHGWLNGSDLYDQHFWLLGIDEYRYSPLVAACFVPLSLLPDSAGGVLWRLLNMAVFFIGVITYCGTVFPGRARMGLAGVAAIGWLLLPLAMSSLNNGQANPVVLGAILLAVAAAQRSRWNLAALALAAAIMIKLYPLAVAMLLLLIYPRPLGWRLALLLVVGVGLSFVLQDPAYVARQYEAWFEKLAREDRSMRSLPDSYRDFWLLLRWAHIPLPHRFYLLLQLVAAAGVAAIVALGRRRQWTSAEVLHRVVDLGCCWMILFGPATENSTYILIAPSYAIAVWEAFAYRRPVWTRALLTAIVCIFAAGTVITALPGGRNWAYPLNPLATLLLLGERLWSLRWRISHEQQDDGVTVAQAKAA